MPEYRGTFNPRTGELRLWSTSSGCGAVLLLLLIGVCCFFGTDTGILPGNWAHDPSCVVLSCADEESELPTGHWTAGGEREGRAWRAELTVPEDAPLVLTTVLTDGETTCTRKSSTGVTNDPVVDGFWQTVSSGPEYPGDGAVAGSPSFFCASSVLVFFDPEGMRLRITANGGEHAGDAAFELSGPLTAV